MPTVAGVTRTAPAVVGLARALCTVCDLGCVPVSDPLYCDRTDCLPVALPTDARAVCGLRGYEACGGEADRNP
jgi:hypothetical protein